MSVALIAWTLTRGEVKALVWFAAALGAGLVALIAGHRNGAHRGWRLFATSQCMVAVCELMFLAEESGWYAPPDLAPSVVAYAITNIVMAIALIRLVRFVAPTLDRIDWVDCTLVIVGPACILWQYVASPLAQHTPSLIARMFLVGILVFDFAFILMAWRLLAAHRGVVSGRLLFCAMIAVAAADTTYDLKSLYGDGFGGPTELMYPVWWALVALAALHPSVKTLTAPSKQVRPPRGRRYFASMAIVAGVSPAAALGEQLWGNGRSLTALSVASLVVFLLVIYRMRILVNEIERAGRSLEIAATHDGLTGLANRSMLMSRLQRALSAAHPAEHRCVLVYADLDGFKAVNDLHGHGAGDELLEEIGRRLLTICRPNDTVARLGGDEFTVLLEGTTDPDVVSRLVDRIRDALTITTLRSGVSVTVSGSIGVALEPLDGCTPAELMHAADSAMYTEKALRREGRLPSATGDVTGNVGPVLARK
jgi:diguanylate cyclase (GGDEF)-like protein